MQFGNGVPPPPLLRARWATAPIGTVATPCDAAHGPIFHCADNTGRSGPPVGHSSSQARARIVWRRDLEKEALRPTIDKIRGEKKTGGRCFSSCMLFFLCASLGSRILPPACPGTTILSSSPNPRLQRLTSGEFSAIN